ncbi:XRE family transcriptional regulator [Ralstonia solanacearum]|uniref:helix-turn-helix transcriptional regulator n=1 Tax=Ralstonia pseudosolanacearum TaxID=1310165 RepID=UPI0009BD7442|nr:helix-turn-helix transcriptional regulator [Ralstonia pseudosolanacearum]AXW57407.1 XRE family transcriptional regulator [Ralstonia solanacearum]UYR00920.1 helix-turn-helix domain-containing protein [Ralstonia pseudosolanacearum]UYR10351.1 helix-turn-helix domain-containing protein [Ralstonia pseudosolanacearum]
MSEIILSPSVYSRSTTVSGCPVFAEGASNLPATSSEALIQLTVVIGPREGLQARTRLPRHIVSAQKEASDPEYRQRMMAARKALGAELFEGRQETLAGLRLKKGLSQNQLAELVGTSQPHIAKIEAGKTRILLDTAAKLAAALDTNLDSIQRCVEATDVKAMIEQS